MPDSGKNGVSHECSTVTDFMQPIARWQPFVTKIGACTFDLGALPGQNKPDGEVPRRPA